MKSETNFLEIIGAITVSILFILLVVWIGWIIFLIFLWGITTYWVFVGINGLLKEKDFENVFLIIMGCFFSSFLFWFCGTYFSKDIFDSMIETMMWYSGLLILIASFSSKMKN